MRERTRHHGEPLRCFDLIPPNETRSEGQRDQRFVRPAASEIGGGEEGRDVIVQFKNQEDSNRKFMRIKENSRIIDPYILC
ncbi:hypothetical protein DFQ26_007974 [Actinomortierella ambigua]|nr:hypothetical protein DFQ26_007974 [Actinomortierella ambigua]